MPNVGGMGCMGGMGGMGGMGTVGMYSMQPGGLSSDAYVDKNLRPLDAEHYSAAGLVPYRKRPGGVELLLAREKPWNSFINAYDPLAWNIFGGKRVSRQERSVEVTAVRCFREAVCDFEAAPTDEVLHNMIPNGFYMWYPLGKYALILVEVEDGSLDDLPEKFAEAKEASPGADSEYRILPMGVKKWKKQIDLLEWVPGEDLAPEAKFEVSDLLSNMLKVAKFLDFLAGRMDPAEIWPKGSQPQRPILNGDMRKGKGKSKDWGGPSMDNGYKGRGKDGWGPGDSNGYKGKGKKGKGKGFGKVAGPAVPFSQGVPGVPLMQMPPPPPMPVYTAPPPAAMQPGSEEMQRQMYGEQLYVLVLPLAPSPYLAQKITGMLLELPQNELVLNLTDPQELQRRVEEALEVLKADGVTN
ncbi:pabpc1a [Symbiodinium natans]|uniref:Pabpc1a protein n=1 Tax=Symbiodinium natans TaxID=878477 RepID=A0A812IC38_9DINO|nr:pabpc1a [Symbiodinium natans]